MMGKVLEFKPRKNRKLKSVDYVEPAKKELYEKRKKQKRLLNKRGKLLKNTVYFVLLCIIVYIINKFI